MRRIPPTGLPGLAPFAGSLDNENVPRLDLNFIRENMEMIFKLQPKLFPPAAQKEWYEFLDQYPKSIDDVVVDDECDVREDAIPKCSVHVPNDDAMTMHQVSNSCFCSSALFCFECHQFKYTYRDFVCTHCRYV